MVGDEVLTSWRVFFKNVVFPYNIMEKQLEALIWSHTERCRASDKLHNQRQVQNNAFNHLFHQCVAVSYT